MPTTYAHWRFGNECIDLLPNEYQKIIHNNRELYDFGVHGPDIFFYYKCYKNNPIMEYGYDTHENPIKNILITMKNQYINSNVKEELMAYILGFVNHFTLDSYCHSYIERKIELSNVSHFKIESQFDRYLLTKDNYNPVKKSTTFSLKPSRYNAKIISILYPNFNEEVIYQTLKDQKFYLNLLKDSNAIKRFILISAFNIAKISKFKDLLMTNNNDERCKDSNERLYKLSLLAKSHFPTLAENIYNYFNSHIELNEYFDNTFSVKKDYKTIPVLNYDDELKYIVK